VEATAPSLHLMDGKSLQGFLYAWAAKPDPKESTASIAKDAIADTALGDSKFGGTTDRGISMVDTEKRKLPLVVSAVVRIRGGTASAAVLKTLSLSYDAGDGLFATLTQQSRPTHSATVGCLNGGAEGAAAELTRTKFCFKLHKTTIETRKTKPGFPSTALASGANRHYSTSGAGPSPTFTIPTVRAAGSMRRRPEILAGTSGHVRTSSGCQQDLNDPHLGQGARSPAIASNRTSTLTSKFEASGKSLDPSGTSPFVRHKVSGTDLDDSVGQMTSEVTAVVEVSQFASSFIQDICA
jgi:hypothetical protein